MILVADGKLEAAKRESQAQVIPAEVSAEAIGTIGGSSLRCYLFSVSRASLNPKCFQAKHILSYQKFF